MNFTRHQRLHLSQGSRLLGWNPETKAEESFDLLAECSADKDTAPGDVLARHLADDGQVSVDVFAAVGRGEVKPAQRQALETRAKEISGSDAVNFERVLFATWSLGTPNRSGIIVPNDAWDLTNFNLNPVGAWNHRTSFSGPESIISRWLLVGHKTSSEKSNLVGWQEFVAADVPLSGPLASSVLALSRFGALNAYSPGFLIGSVDFENEEAIVFGSKDKPNELVELSNVPVPRHPGAVRNALESGAVEIEPLREFIAHQLEVAYADPMKLMEAAQLEAWAVKLGIGEAAFVDMSADDIEAYELSGTGANLEAVDELSPETDQLMASALRSGDPLEGDESSWERFTAAWADELSDESLVLIANAAGLSDESDALCRVMALEGEAMEGSDDQNQLAVDGLDTKSFAGLFKSALQPVTSSVQKTTGRLVIPA